MGSRCSLKSIHSSGSLHSSLQRLPRVALTLLSCVKESALSTQVDGQDTRHASMCPALPSPLFPLKCKSHAAHVNNAYTDWHTHTCTHAAKSHKVTLGSFCVPDEPSFFGLPLLCHTSVFPPLLSSLPSALAVRPLSLSLALSPPLFSWRFGAGSV